MGTHLHATSVGKSVLKKRWTNMARARPERKRPATRQHNTPLALRHPYARPQPRRCHTPTRTPSAAPSSLPHLSTHSPRDPADPAVHPTLHATQHATQHTNLSAHPATRHPPTAILSIQPTHLPKNTPIYHLHAPLQTWLSWSRVTGTSGVKVKVKVGGVSLHRPVNSHVLRPALTLSDR